MGSIISAISDDIDEYEELCAKYGEEVQTSKSYRSRDRRDFVMLADPYGEHARELKRRDRKDRGIKEYVPPPPVPFKNELLGDDVEIADGQLRKASKTEIIFYQGLRTKILAAMASKNNVLEAQLRKTCKHLIIYDTPTMTYYLRNCACCDARVRLI